MLIGMGTAAVVSKGLTTGWVGGLVGSAAEAANESIRAGEAVPGVWLEGGEKSTTYSGQEAETLFSLSRS